jgi:hypothetical protein
MMAVALWLTGRLLCNLSARWPKASHFAIVHCTYGSLHMHTCKVVLQYIQGRTMHIGPPCTWDLDEQGETIQPQVALRTKYTIHFYL